MLIPHISLSLLALHSRRDLIHGITTIAIANILTTSSPAIADDSSSELYLARPMGLTTTNGVKDAISRPSAPIEYLLPAARVGVYIYTCVNLAEAIAAKEKEDGLLAKLDELENLLVNPPSFVKSSDPRPTRGDPYKLPPVVGELVMQQQKQKERQQNSIDVGAIPQFFEVGQLIGERRAWDRLTKAETRREEQSEVRRAFNIYTTNINFNTSQYTFAGSKEEKRQLIREDKLPTVGAVIRSDLDARDLYRNEVQTALDDAKAEFSYQKRACQGDVTKFDAQDLVSLINTAKKAVDSWFSFVPDKDIMMALEMVKNE